MNKIACAALAAASLSLAGPAAADTLDPRSNDVGSITRIGRGVKELGVDNLLVIGYDRTGGASQLRATYVGGPTFRYFLVDNVSLALGANVLYKSLGDGTTTASTLGGLGTVSIDYRASLGHGMFFVPALGVGGFYASQSTPLTAGTATQTALYGATGRVGAGLVYYASRTFNLSAGPEALISFGKASDAGAGTQSSFTSMDAGFNVGLAYVF